MAQNTTITIPARTWTQLTDGDVTNITFQVLNANQSVLIKGTAGAVVPTTLSGSAWYQKGQGELAVSLSELFLGVAGANRVYAYCEAAAEVFVSNA